MYRRQPHGSVPNLLLSMLQVQVVSTSDTAAVYWRRSFVG